MEGYVDLEELRRLIDEHEADLDRPTFWRLVEASKILSAGSCRDQVVWLRHLLTRLRPEAIVQFERIWRDYFDEAYSEDLWAAAYTLNGGCSDDGFFYFRQWLIGQGEAVYRGAVRDPDTLVDVVDPPPPEPTLLNRYECELLGYVARNAYEELTGQEMPWYSIDTPLRGEAWEDCDLPRKLPRLWAVFGLPLGEDGPSTP